MKPLLVVSCVRDPLKRSVRGLEYFDALSNPLELQLIAK
jgi:hypothetical protein